MHIYLRTKLKPLGRKDVTIHVRESNQFKEFNIGDVTVAFIPGSPEILGEITISGNDQLLAYYQDDKKVLPRNPQLEVHRDNLYNTIREVLKYLKYFYGISEVHEQYHLSGGFEWSLDQRVWKPVPEKHETRWLPGGFMYTLDDNFLSHIPRLIDAKIEPFFAFTHLHKAFAETNTRHQWINATIAAELAFKEFLSRLDGKTTTLITQVPSPPLNKLYRDVLKDYTGEESPMHSKLGKGAERRNHLIHRTTEPSPTPAEALIYTCQVQVAIFHLYKMLYKDDPLFAYLLQHMSGYLIYVEQNAAKLV